MRLEKLILANFRNIQSADLRPGEELTVITGANGQGKTNLLEAVWLLTGAKSFRGAKDPQLIREGQQFAVMEGAIFRQDRGEDYIRITVGTKESPRPGRTAKLNGADAGRAEDGAPRRWGDTSPSARPCRASCSGGDSGDNACHQA